MSPSTSARPATRRPRSRFPAWLGLVLLATLGLGAAAPLSTADQQVKAGFVFNFAKFVEWPEGKMDSGSGPIVIGVLSQNPIGAQIAATVKDRQINGRGLVVRAVSTPAEIRSVHLLFVAHGDQRRFLEFAPALAGAGVLTVGEAPGFARTGGMIGFVLEANKVRFEIHPAVAERDGLRLSSQLLKLATIVRQERP